jgi:integrase
MTVAKIFKRCDCGDWNGCPHSWVVRYRTTGGRSSRQREQSFGDDLREAEDFALKVEHDKRARTFVDPKAGRILFRDAAGTWLDQHLGADSSIATYRSVLRAHIDPAIGGKPIGAIRREDIKALIAGMHRKGLSASRIGCAHLVISAVLAEAVRDKKLAESPCSGVQIPAVITAANFILPAHAQIEAVAAGLPSDGYLFQGRKYKLVVRRSYQEDFQRAAAGAGLPPEFIPHSLRHLYASTALAEGIPITEVSRWLGHKSIEVTHQIYGHLVPASWDRARNVLDDARRAARHHPRPGTPR